MRILCSVALSPSNARALIPLARAAAESGHEIVVVSPPEMAGAFEGEGIPVVPRLSDLAEILLSLLHDKRVDFIAQDPFAVDTLVQYTCGPQVTDAYRVLMDVAADFKPDIIVRSGVEFAGLLVAQQLGIPHIAAPSGGGQYLDQEKVLAELNERRTELGLPAGRGTGDTYEYGRFDCLPQEFSFATHAIPETFCYQQPSSIVSAETRPDWLDDLPADKPLVVVSSTNVFASLMSSKVVPRLLDFVIDNIVAGHLFEGMNGLPIDPADLLKGLTHAAAHTLDAVVEGLSQVDCTAVVATRGLPVNEALAGDNVRLFEQIPQPLLLENAHLLFTHGGYNSIRESLRAGVPMAILPEISDQAHNAGRVAELGVGLRVPAAEPDAIAKTCRELLGDRKFGQQARVAQRRMLTLPAIDAAVAHLEGLARRVRTR